MPARPRPKRIVAIDWDDCTLRVVHAHLVKRGVKIDKLLSVVLPQGLDPNSPHHMGLHIKQTLAQAGIAAKHAVVDIPRDQVILKTLTLPIAQPQELPGMVEIQIAKELPFPSTEAVIDFAVDPVEKEQLSSHVLVAAIRHELLEQYEATFAAAGLKLDRIGLRPYANKVAVCHLLKHAVPERVLFIDVRPTFMEIDVLRNGTLSFSRSASVVIPKGLGDAPTLSIARPDSPRDGIAGVDLPGAVDQAQTTDSVVHSLLLEVTRSIEAYRADDPGAMIDHVVIGGDVGVEEALMEAIQRRLELTAEMYNPASTFGWEPDEGAGAVAFAASLGLVLGHAEDDALHFDFLHPKKTVSLAKQRLQEAPMVAAVAVLFIAAASVLLGYYTKPSRDKLAGLEREIKSLKLVESSNKRFLKLVDEIRAFDQDQHIWVDELYDVFTLLPGNDEMLVNHVDMKQKDHRIKLKTRCKRRETPTEIIQKMAAFRRDGREKPRFKVRMGPQTEKKRERYPFSQELRIEILDDASRTKRSAKSSSRR